MDDTSSTAVGADQRISCLRRGPRGDEVRPTAKRTVSFPEDESRIVTGYLEPVNPWIYSESTSKESIISSYVESCRKHGSTPNPKVLIQIQELDYADSTDRYDLFDLRGEKLTLGGCEALEEVLKRVQFRRFDLGSTQLDDESSVAIFDMIEYYEAATHLDISSNPNIGQRGWQACSRMLKRTKSLESLECRDSPLNESLVQFLSRALRLGTQLQILKLENCSLSGRPIVILAAALKLNTTIKELHLSDNDLTSLDATQISALLKCNSTLQLLNLSNNVIADVGLGVICEALAEQNRPTGLTILILWNNKLKALSAHHVSKVFEYNKTLEMLNIGRNDLTDEFLDRVKDSLGTNSNVSRLGIQSTRISSIGASSLAQALVHNSTLRRIDMRDNRIGAAGLRSLRNSLRENFTVTQIDLDDTDFDLDIDLRRHLDELDSLAGDDYPTLLDEIRSVCSRNEIGCEGEALIRVRMIAARKISLTCDTRHQQQQAQHSATSNQNSFLGVTGVDFNRKGGGGGSGGRLRSPAPSPIPSPLASPSPTRNRFQVSKVTEDSPVSSIPTSADSAMSSSSSSNVFFNRSRFRVTTVEDEKENDEVATAMAQNQNPQTSSQSGSTPSPGIGGERARKISSWMNPIFPEAASGIEKFLGIFQNPFGTG